MKLSSLLSKEKELEMNAMDKNVSSLLNLSVSGFPS